MLHLGAFQAQTPAPGASMNLLHLSIAYDTSLFFRTKRSTERVQATHPLRTGTYAGVLTAIDGQRGGGARLSPLA